MTTEKSSSASVSPRKLSKGSGERPAVLTVPRKFVKFTEEQSRELAQKDPKETSLSVSERALIATAAEKERVRHPQPMLSVISECLACDVVL